MNKQLCEVESLCLGEIRKGNSEVVEMYFGPYISYNPSTENSAFIKAYMLLYHLSTGTKKRFYTTIETVTPTELENPSIKLVIEVDMCMNIGAVERLKNAVERNTIKEFDRFLRDILESQMKIMEFSESSNESSLGIQSQEDKKAIEDAIFIGRNSSANF
ncbi:hypothetical protein EROM_110250 [Encephalitozoon romaleae SJ-2008]|uniref:Uncharacterized protein n=1 Tax=Encephalitozoon romaleae (strain SJ-2008) TaxID=1178016 RepID=I6ZL09_ENCRO|nr:hypothetical protein EROM_110250 [Encephalitozoon romaleae SJ-2008]AFN84008.1 hypothetical protein EROM_110250 [Encephalitozoon romaleae SJ-2008]